MIEHSDPVAFILIEDGVTKPYTVVTVFEKSGRISKSFDRFESALSYGQTIAKFWMVELRVVCRIPWDQIKEIKDEGED
jgi:hypothetical protein